VFGYCRGIKGLGREDLVVATQANVQIDAEIGPKKDFVLKLSSFGNEYIFLDLKSER